MLPNIIITERFSLTSINIQSLSYILMTHIYIMMYILSCNPTATFPESREREQSMPSVPYRLELTTLKVDLRVPDSCSPQTRRLGFCREIVANCCVCGSFEVVLDGLERNIPPKTERKNCLTVFL